MKKNKHAQHNTTNETTIFMWFTSSTRLRPPIYLFFYSFIKIECLQQSRLIHSRLTLQRIYGARPYHSTLCRRVPFSNINLYVLIIQAMYRITYYIILDLIDSYHNITMYAIFCLIPKQTM